MKQLLFALLIAPFISLAQKDTAITYTDVVTVDSVSKSELFNRARTWFNNSFKSGKDVIQVQDKETGEISGKGNFRSTFKMYGLPSPAFINFQVNIRVKDNKYKYEFVTFNVDFEQSSLDDYTLLTSSPLSPNRPRGFIGKNKNDEYWKNVKLTVDERIKIIIDSLKKAMNTTPSDF